MMIDSNHITIYYSPQCSFTLNCIYEIKEYMKDCNIQIDFIKVDTLEKAKTYHVFLIIGQFLKMENMFHIFC